MTRKKLVLVVGCAAIFILVAFGLIIYGIYSAVNNGGNDKSLSGASSPATKIDAENKFIVTVVAEATAHASATCPDGTSAESSGYGRSESTARAATKEEAYLLAQRDAQARADQTAKANAEANVFCPGHKAPEKVYTYLPPPQQPAIIAEATVVVNPPEIPTPSPTYAAAPTNTFTPTPTSTVKPASTAMYTPTPINTARPTSTATYTPTPINTARPTSTATYTPSPTYTSTPTSTRTPTPTPTSTATATPTVTPTPTTVPTLSIRVIPQPNVVYLSDPPIDILVYVSGTATGTITYRVDCESNGTWDYTVDTNEQTLTVHNLCRYNQTGEYWVKVEVNRQELLIVGTSTVIVLN